MRASAASFNASHARSMSLSLQRARPQIVAPRTVLAISRTASKSPGEAIGKPASITSTPKIHQRLRHFQLFLEIHAAAGRLLAVAQGRVENHNRSGLFRGHGSDVGVRGWRSDWKWPATYVTPELNYYRLEAGRFEDFVSYGLEVLRSRGVTVNLSSPSLGSVPSWPRIYSAIASSVTLPLDATK